MTESLTMKKTTAGTRELREFVYLDRDSVVSLLASIEGAIKQERIEQIGSRSTKRVAGGVNASIFLGWAQR